MTANRTDNIPYAAPVPDDIDAILRKHLNVTGDNIRLREELATARKARDAAQELIEAERQKNAALNDKLINAEDARASNASSALEQIGRVKELRLLRTNDAATIADLERRLREAEGQLKAQREAAPGPFGDPAWASKGVSQWVSTDWANAKIEWYARQRTRLATENAGLHETVKSQEATIRRLNAQIEVMPVTVRGEPTVARKVLEAELEEMRRTFRLIAGTTKEYFDLITELAADPADEKRKEPKP